MDDGIERKPTRPYISSNPGFYREAGPVDWLRTQEGVWLRSTFPFNSCWIGYNVLDSPMRDE